MKINQDLIFENWMTSLNDLLNPDDCLFEVSAQRSQTLRQIDYNFLSLQQNLKNTQAKKDLIRNIKEFTNIKDVKITIKKNFYNAAVIPIYTRALPIRLNVFQKVKQLFDNVSDTSIHKAQESSEFIERIYIIIGAEMIHALSSRGLTAVLLHEIGHVFSHTSNFPTIIERWMKTLSTLGFVKTAIISPFLTSTVSLPISAMFLLVSRTLTFVEHLGEYGADKYAAKYGYADEIIKVLHKFQQEEHFANKQKSFFRKIFDFLFQMFFPKTHPSDNKRICKLAEDMKTKYKDLYPKLNQELITILSDFKCGINIFSKT